MNFQKIIRSYDIRGIYNSELKLDDIKKVINSFAQFLILNYKNIKISLGMDNRPSSLEIFNIIKNELSSFPLTIYDCNITTSPALSYFSKHHNCFGIMITASHNHIKYNGLKFIKPDMQTFDGNQIKRIINDYPYNPQNNIFHSPLIKSNCNQFYLDFLLTNFPYINNKTKICWNLLNGSSSSIILKLLTYYNNLNFVINCDLKNLKQNPDPINQTNVRETKNSILSDKCDIGFSFDGDCDRILVFNKNGLTINTEHLMMIFAKYWQDKINNKIMICDVKSSHKLKFFLNSMNYELIVGEIGHSKMKKKMYDTNAKMSGEISGHFIFDNLKFDDGLYTALLLIKIINELEISLEDILSSLPKIFSSKNLKIYLEDEEIETKLKKIENYIEKHKIVCNRIDGIKLLFEDGWILFRKSQTENCLTAKFESYERKNFSKIKKLYENLIQI